MNPPCNQLSQHLLLLRHLLVETPPLLLQGQLLLLELFLIPARRQADRPQCHCTRPLTSQQDVAGSHTHTPLLGELPLPLALLLFLPLQLLPELLALAFVVLASPLVRLQQLGLVQRLQLVQLLFVFGNELLDLWFEA